MKKYANLKAILDQLSNDNLNLVTEKRIVAGWGSNWTITDGGDGWSISHLWGGTRDGEPLPED